jgi:pyridoxamine 5'-phosphate oxidase
MATTDGERHDWSGLREDYARGGLTEADLTDEPFEMFHRWMDDAIAAQLPEPNAMVAATATTDGVPSVRMVLLKGVSPEGFVFFTNLWSRKGEELRANPACALLFPWHPLERQIRVEGPASVLDEDEVAAYFATRPRRARLGAWASRQSREVSGREELTATYAALEARYGAGDDGEPVPVPSEWGGFRVRPDSFEFWQGRPGRMHDRLVYRRTPEDATTWTTHRLAP